MLLFSDVSHVGEVCESKWSYVLEVPDVDFIRPCVCFLSSKESVK